jgi:HAD superfamily hydrolase (TIGR01509 family)
MNLSNLRAVIFDMDGLLVDSERLAHLALIQTASAFGTIPDPKVFTRMIGLPEDGSIDLLKRHYGPDFPAERFIREAAITCEALVDSDRLALKKGAAELLDALESSGVPKGVATSSSRTKAMHTLTKVHLADRFEVIVTRTEVQNGKPRPDLYLRAAHELGFAVDRCIALEDSYIGVRAAHAAGMRVIMVPDLLCPTAEIEELSEAVAKDLCAVLDVFVNSGLVLQHAACAS